jgi:hypothetical protein
VHGDVVIVGEFEVAWEGLVAAEEACGAWVGRVREVEDSGGSVDAFAQSAAEGGDGILEGIEGEA